ncbi:MAG: hypothetical protein WD988_00805 [Candidatus Curtissbacteria bacterium]
MATPETRPSMSITEKALRWLGSASAAMDRSPEAQTFKASAEIVRKVDEAIRKASLFPIRLDPEILELVRYSMIIIAAEQMEAKGRYAGANFDLMKDAAQKTRAIFITRQFTDERYKYEALNGEYDRQIAGDFFGWFYGKNPKPDEIFDHMDNFVPSRTALEQLFRYRQVNAAP